MILDDDLDPKTKKPKPRNLDLMSVAELKDYMQALKDEMARVEKDLARKDSSRAAADAFFKQ